MPPTSAAVSFGEFLLRVGCRAAKPGAETATRGTFPRCPETAIRGRRKSFPAVRRNRPILGKPPRSLMTEQDSPEGPSNNRKGVAVTPNGYGGGYATVRNLTTRGLRRNGFCSFCSAAQPPEHARRCGKRFLTGPPPSPAARKDTIIPKPPYPQKTVPGQTNIRFPVEQDRMMRKPQQKPRGRRFGENGGRLSACPGRERCSPPSAESLTKMLAAAAAATAAILTAAAAGGSG